MARMAAGTHEERVAHHRPAVAAAARGALRGRRPELLRLSGNALLACEYGPPTPGV